ncbi:MAG: peptide chain release factor N(5)-glutamine methyltransferase [Acidimicrobiales bacterium]|nr:peptide chain release factor N(5)-glutamine methyltransferase [Acidimicrobiales bacterium]
MTLVLRALRDEAVQRLAAAGVDDPGQEARWMVERATGWTAAAQAGALDEALTERQLRFLDLMVERRVTGEPLQYVLGRWAFRTLDLLVDRRVLIPRPETEGVAGLAIDLVAERPGEDPTIVADLGTGSGAIALSVAAECWPHVEVWGTDASADALAVARANLAALGRRAAAVRLEEGDWFGALPPEVRGRLAVVVSNPPYVAASEALPPAVADWEPDEALVSGPTGLEAIGRIVSEAPEWLATDGALVLEIGETQGAAAAALARAAGFADVDVRPDLAGRPRAVVARLRA